MKKITVLSMGMCAVLALASCGTSKESAYKKAYEKAQQQEQQAGHAGNDCHQNHSCRNHSRCTPVCRGLAQDQARGFFCRAAA